MRIVSRLGCWALLAALVLCTLSCSSEIDGPDDPGAPPGDQTPPDLGQLEIIPADGATAISGRTLRWLGVTDDRPNQVAPITYRVFLDVTDPPSTHLYSGPDRACTVGPLAPGTKYYWSIVARDAAGNEAESGIFSFTTAAEPSPHDLLLIPGGTFIMGSPEDEPGRWASETRHTVTLTTAFWMQPTEVTNLQYAHLAQWAVDRGLAAVVVEDRGDEADAIGVAISLRDAMDGSGEELLDLDATFCEIDYVDGVLVVESGREDHPVREVSWFGAAAFCDWLSLRHGLPRAYDHFGWRCNDHRPYTADGYRLPTEAEWEYACRAGTTTPFSSGACLDAGTEANVNGRCPYRDCPSGPALFDTAPVATFQANTWDLHDLHGNLREWCNDWFGPYEGDATDPAGPVDPVPSSFPPGPATPLDPRVIRGGDGLASGFYSRSASRFPTEPGDLYDRAMWIGFRVVRSDRD